MADEILRPIDALKPGTYRPQSASDGFRSRLTDLAAATFSIKERGTAIIQQQYPTPIRGIYGKYCYESTSRGWYSSWSRTTQSYGPTDGSGRRYLYPVFKLPTDSATRCGIIQEGSVLAGYCNAKAKSRVWTLKSLAKQEARRLARFQRNQQLSYKKYEERIMAAEAKWEKTRQERLNRLETSRTSLESRRDRISLLLQENLEWREYLVARSRKTDRLDARIANRQSQLSRLDLRITAVQAKIEGLLSATFQVRKPWIPRNYVPKFYDFSTQTALFPVSVPAKIKSMSPHPVDHVKFKATWNPQIGIPLEFNFTTSTSTTKTEVEQHVVLDNNAVIPNITAYTHLDRGGAFPYHSIDVETAARSIRWDIPQESDLPVFLAELNDTESTIASAIRVFNALRGRKVGTKYIDSKKTYIRRRNFTDMARALCGADLARKFAVEPAYSDGLNIIKATLEEQLKNWKTLDKWLSNRGKVLRTQRKVGDKTIVTDHQDIFFHSLWTLQNMTWPTGQGEYTHEWKNDFPDGYEDSEGKESKSIDIMSIIDAIHSAGRTYFGSRPILRRSSISAVEQRLTVFYSYDAFDEFGWEIDRDEVYRRATLDRLGMFLDVSKVWELIPLSFVIDWFTNVSQLLGKLSIRNLRPTYTVYGAMLSQKETVGHTLQSVTPEVKLPADRVVRADISRYRRQFISIDPSWVQEGKQITVRWKSPSWWQLITAIEMGVN